jgi:hypothetical protein
LARPERGVVCFELVLPRDLDSLLAWIANEREEKKLFSEELEKDRVAFITRGI